MVTETMRQAAREHYYNNVAHYEQIWARLADVRERFENAPLSGKVARAKLSYCFAVISIQTSVDKHEEAFARLVRGEDVEMALRSVNYNNQKVGWIEDTLQKNNEWEEFVSLLETDIDSAHKFAIDNFKGVSTAKAPFMLAMLGYTSKMCIDTNIQQLCEVEEPSTVVVSRYEEACDEVKEAFPHLAEELSAFGLQWVLFSFQRGNTGRLAESVDHHAIWFDTCKKSDEEIQEIVNVA